MGGDTFYDDKTFKRKMCTMDTGHYVKNISNIACVSVLNFQNIILQKNYYIFIILPEIEITMIFEVLTAATVLWDMMPCSQGDVYRHAE